jgi:hypothetical protein
MGEARAVTVKTEKEIKEEIQELRDMYDTTEDFCDDEVNHLKGVIVALKDMNADLVRLNNSAADIVKRSVTAIRKMVGHIIDVDTIIPSAMKEFVDRAAELSDRAKRAADTCGGSTTESPSINIDWNNPDNVKPEQVAHFCECLCVHREECSGRCKHDMLEDMRKSVLNGDNERIVILLKHMKECIDPLRESVTSK